MDERLFDTLPELGTPAAAVAGIESMLHAAIRLREPFSPLQLRYWLDAYYQARLAAVGWMETPHQSPAATASPQGEAQSAEIQVDQFGFEKEGDGAAKAAGIEIEDEAAELHHQSPAATASPQGEAMKAEDGQEDAAETQQTAEPAAKPQRQRPVGWTDGNQLSTDPATYSGAAAAAKFKREQFERLQRFLREGVSMQRIVKAAEGNITEDQILGIRECRRVPVAVYRVLEAALDQIETD